MTKAQVRWAEAHDWFISAREVSPGNWRVTADATVYWQDGRVDVATATFTDFQALRAHAGY